MNRSELAKEMKVSLTTIDNWLRRGCPHSVNGRNYDFDRDEVERWRYQQEEGIVDYGDNPDNISRAEAAKKMLQVFENVLITSFLQAHYEISFEEAAKKVNDWRKPAEVKELQSIIISAILGRN